jgi:hypothetical protein
LSKMIWARSIPEIKADFYVEAIRLVTEHAWKYRMVVITNVPIVLFH